MIRASEIMGMKIISKGENLETYSIKSLLFDNKLKNLKYFAIKEKILFESADIIKAEDTRIIDRERIQIIKKLIGEDEDNTKDTIDFKYFLKDIVFDDNNMALGKVCDILVNSKSYEVLGVELSKGYLDDILGGRQQIFEYEFKKIDDKLFLSLNKL